MHCGEPSSHHDTDTKSALKYTLSIAAILARYRECAFSFFQPRHTQRLLSFATGAYPQKLVAQTQAHATARAQVPAAASLFPFITLPPSIPEPLPPPLLLQPVASTAKDAAKPGRRKHNEKHKCQQPLRGRRGSRVREKADQKPPGKVRYDIIRGQAAR